MTQEIRTISLSLPFRLGRVNSYLIKTTAGYILIDTGCSCARADLEKELGRAGCVPGSLKAIIITHGDFDHTGNAAYLRKKYGVKILMHRDDSGMAELGNMFWNRKKSNTIVKLIAPIATGFGRSERFRPDFYIEDWDSLSEYGFDAKVLCIPGHSKGSIGVLTADGDLICGDLFENARKPSLNSIMDDLAAANASIERLKGLNIKAVYPGHGRPFLWEEFLKSVAK